MRPIGKPAPPRPRTPASSSSVDDLRRLHAQRLAQRLVASDGLVLGEAREVMPVGVLEEEGSNRHADPPARSSAVARARANLRDERRDVVAPRPARGSGGRPTTTGPQPQPPAHSSVLSVTRPSACRLTGLDPELALERLERLLCADERAGDVRADLDEVLADRLELEHVVEARDGLAVGRGQVERLGHLAEGLRRQPAVALLREAQRRQHRRPPHGYWSAISWISS